MNRNDLTGKLLLCGLIAGPFYVLVGLVQILIRPGFDVTRHALSLMSNGDLGWIQVANFFITGILVIAFAAGMRRSLKGTPAGTWGPILVAIYGIGLIGAGIFSADPAFGFPPGTPMEAHGISTSGLMHFVCGGIGFYALIAACFVIARRFASKRLGRWMWFSILTGIVFFAAFIGIASGSGGSAEARTIVTLAFYFAIVLIWVWMTAVSVKFRTQFQQFE
ncbi:MAG: DUF998 domain-containing protein [Pyrinomonadaceae bacterium]